MTTSISSSQGMNPLCLTAPRRVPEPIEYRNCSLDNSSRKCEGGAARQLSPLAWINTRSHITPLSHIPIAIRELLVERPRGVTRFIEKRNIVRLGSDSLLPAQVTSKSAHSLSESESPARWRRPVRSASWVTASELRMGKPLAWASMKAIGSPSWKEGASSASMAL